MLLGILLYQCVNLKFSPMDVWEEKKKFQVLLENTACSHPLSQKFIKHIIILKAVRQPMGKKCFTLFNPVFFKFIWPHLEITINVS